MGQHIEVHGLEYDNEPLVIPYYLYLETQFFERWHWTLDQFEGLPLSARTQLSKVLKALADRDERLARPPPTTTPT